MKRISGWVLTGMLALGFLAPTAAPAQAPAAEGPTMFVVPARYSVLQVMFDVLRHYALVLVSYQGDAQSDRPALHAWNGQEWVPVSMEKFREASFLVNKPDRVVLVGEPSQLPPALGEAASVWCSRVMTLTQLDTPSLVNACGKLFNFPPAVWRWFAARYNMELKDENAQRRKDSWYYRPWIEPAYQVNLKAEAYPAEPPAEQKSAVVEPVAEPVPAAPAPETRPAGAEAPPVR